MMTGPAETVFDGEWMVRAELKLRARQCGCGAKRVNQGWDATDGRQATSPVPRGKSSFRGLRRSDRRNLGSGHAIPDRRAADRHAAQKNVELEARLAELIDAGATTTTSSFPPVDARALRISRDYTETTLAVLYHSLADDFGVPHAATAVWGKMPSSPTCRSSRRNDVELREYADGLGAPYCGPAAPFDANRVSSPATRASRSPLLPLRPRAASGCSGSPARIRAVWSGNGRDLSHPAGRLASVATRCLTRWRSRRGDVPDLDAAKACRAGAGPADAGAVELPRGGPTRVDARRLRARRDAARSARRRNGAARDLRRRAGDAARSRPRRPQPRARAVVVARVLLHARARSRNRRKPCARPQAHQVRAPAPRCAAAPTRRCAWSITSAGLPAVRDRALLELLYSSGLRLSRRRRGRHRPRRSRARRSHRLGQGPEGAHRSGRRAGAGSDSRFTCLRAAIRGADADALFVGKSGARMTPAASSAAALWATRQGLSRRVHPHMLRRWFPMLSVPGDLRAVQGLLGHASIASTPGLHPPRFWLPRQGLRPGAPRRAKRRRT